MSLTALTLACNLLAPFLSIHAGAINYAHPEIRERIREATPLVTPLRPGVAAQAVLDGSVIKFDPAYCNNPNLAPERQEMLIAHEFGHLIAMNLDGDRSEAMADYYAVKLLPRERAVQIVEWLEGKCEQYRNRPGSPYCEHARQWRNGLTR